MNSSFPKNLAPLKSQLTFPAGFFWGAATSAHQVEGNNRNDWSEWEKANAKRLVEEAKKKHWPDYLLNAMPSPLNPENYISGRACDHYHRFRDDFDIAQKLGHNAHRFSIEWSRIEPEEGKFDEREIEHYREVIRALRERGLEPFVTLWHWTVPLWFKDRGGWEWKESPEAFSRFVEKTVRSLPQVRYWIILNETNVYSVFAYLIGRRPLPYKSVWKYMRVNSKLVQAHCKSYRLIKSISSSLWVGTAESNVFFEAAGLNPWNQALKLIYEFFWNRRFLNRVRDCCDFIGINYYSHNRIDGRLNRNENKIVSDMGWELYPEGLYRVLKNVSRRYQKPVFVTENGLADVKDDKRPTFIRTHIDAMLRAKKEGADIRGYFYWSLLDNFEWDDGFWPRFGLVEVDYKTLERKIRPSAWEYKKIIERGL